MKWRSIGPANMAGRITDIAVHNKDPSLWFVATEDRDVFKTTNGGETWEKVFFVHNKTGVIDMTRDPTNPDTIIATFWDRARDGFDSWPDSVAKLEGIDGYDPIRKWGPGSGL